ncbi:MAG: 4Fe-4S dicluster domain-containing protein, partial [Candidatus Binatia bacterium]
VRIVDEKFFGFELTHKFKISFSGCPIDCARTSDMDLGFQGAVRPKLNPDTCIGCAICSHACKEDAIEAHPETEKPVYHPEKCLYCGDCIRACPTDSWGEDVKGWNVRVGGKHGRHPILGSRIAEFVSDEDVPRFVETTVQWYKENAKDLGRTRIGAVLQSPEKWESYIETIRNAFGALILESPQPPTPTEIHF